MRLLFLPVISGKPWNGLTVLSQPLGGSEAAVAYLAKSLSRKGHHVEVVTHGEPCTDEAGVVYHTQDYANVFDQPWDTVISSRWPEILLNDWKTHNRALWLHDLPNQSFQVKATHVVALTEFHAQFYQMEAPKTIIGDGWDDRLLANLRIRGERDENKLVWTSNPDRGLPLAASIFQTLRKRWPSLELHVYGRSAVYGWSDDVERPYLPRREHRENVFMHAPVPRAELFKILSTAWALFYPTFWPETFCMAALEAQALGCPVIASPYGALNETVKGGILSYDFLNSVSQLRNKRRWEKLSLAGIEWAKENTWDCVADKWLAEVLQ